MTERAYLLEEQEVLVTELSKLKGVMPLFALARNVSLGNQSSVQSANMRVKTSTNLRVEANANVPMRHTTTVPASRDSDTATARSYSAHEQKPVIGRGNMDYIYSVATDNGEGVDQPRKEEALVKCNTCNRTFAASRISRHQEHCTTGTKCKKKDFSLVRRRDLIQRYGAEAVGPKGDPNTKIQRLSWRQQRAQLQQALHQNSDNEISEYVDLRIPCPHCQRKFSQTAAERHIPKCFKNPYKSLN